MNFYKTLVVVFCIMLLQTPALFAQQTSGSGTVAETMNVGSYIYVRLEEDGTWVAASAVKVSEGDVVEYTGGALMKGFYSSKLDRTFEDIVFASGFKVVGEATVESQVAAAHGTAGGHSQMAAAVAMPSAGELPPMDGGHTVEQVVTNYQALDGQQVSLRARVMKVSVNIMGKNWVTLQDGTGIAPENKLMVTTQETVKPGDTVIVTGVIANDVSLGYGYDYKVLLEEASFSQ